MTNFPPPMARHSLAMLGLCLLSMLSGCTSEPNQDPFEPRPAEECAPACVPASTLGLSGPSICFDGCNYCQCTASGPAHCTASACLDAGSEPLPDQGAP
ncbi:MAG: hypothetical protein R3B40_25945 [Polyangiales bacterium]|nr:hypothetical protein [Myxococcales bacterium]